MPDQTAYRSFTAVGLPEARRRAYPHELSGGECQRVMNAMALVCRPHVILADEPTSGLDPAVQDQVLESLLEPVRAPRTTLLLISHDLEVVARRCEDQARDRRLRLANRCDRVMDVCRTTRPSAREVQASQEVSCFLYEAR